MKEREGSHLSLVEHDKILQEELGKQKMDSDAAVTRATKEYAKDLEKMERRVIDAEIVLKELAEPIERLSIGIWGKFRYPFSSVAFFQSSPLFLICLYFLGRQRGCRLGPRGARPPFRCVCP